MLHFLAKFYQNLNFYLFRTAVNNWELEYSSVDLEHYQLSQEYTPQGNYSDNLAFEETEDHQTQTQTQTRDVGIQCNLGCVKKTCTTRYKVKTDKLVHKYLTEKGCSTVRIQQIMNGGTGKRYQNYTEEEICFGLV